MTYPRPAHEAERLRALKRYNILETPPEESFDRITRLAAELFDVPTVLLSLIEENRQWFKSRFCFSGESTDREVAFCAHAIMQEEPLVVENATEDPRFADNPLVTGQPGIRFYAGASLTTPDGFNIGTLCVIDTKPRSFGEKQVRQLSDLAAMAMDELELRREVASRRKHEHALQASEARFRGLVSNLPGLVYRCTYDPKWTSLYMSGRVAELCGISARPVDSENGSFKELVHPEDLADVQAAVR